MVYLTFVRCADLNAYGSISLSDAKALFLLAKIVTEKFGKPQMFFASGNDEALTSARVFNLVCAVRGICETTALNHQASSSDIRAFLDYLEMEGEHIHASHIVLICTHEAFVKIFHKNPVFANAYTLCAATWNNIILDYQEIWSPFTLSDSTPHPIENIAKLPCDEHETVLIEQTVRAYNHVY